MVELSTIGTQFRFETSSMDANTIRIEVKAKEYTTVRGFQYALKWDASVMEHLSVESGAITGITATNYHATPGQLSLYYLQGLNDDDTYGENETLFTLVFNALAPIGSTTILELDESEIPLQVVVEECKLANPSVLSTEVTVQTTAVIEFEDTGLQVKVAPNPIRPRATDTTGNTQRANTAIGYSIVQPERLAH